MRLTIKETISAQYETHIITAGDLNEFRLNSKTLRSIVKCSYIKAKELAKKMAQDNKLNYYSVQNINCERVCGFRV